MIILKKGTNIKIIISLFLAVIYFSPNSIQSKIYAYETPSYYSSAHLKDKHQMINGPCWAFANIATLETFLNKKGILKGNLSEKHLLSWANKNSESTGWHLPINHGGNNTIANGYFFSGCGPVLEKDCTYNIKNTYFNTNLSKIKPEYWIKGQKIIDTDINSIKKAITKYGAVTIIYPVRSDLFHSVSIVGWNDANKSWLVKDSAKAFNYTNLPYSTTIVECSCFTDAEKFHPDQKIYQYDNFCVNCVYGSNTGPYSNYSNKITVANVFDFNGNESLDYITMYSTAENAKLNLFCAPVLKNGNPSNNISTWKNLYSGVIPYKGYFTVKLNSRINLDKNRYAIIAQIEKTNNSKGLPNIGCQVPYENLTLEPNKPGKSFIFSYSRFYDIYDIPMLRDISGFSLKAITKSN